jgi:hypothetical protein
MSGLVMSKAEATCFVGISGEEQGFLTRSDTYRLSYLWEALRVNACSEIESCAGEGRKDR